MGQQAEDFGFALEEIEADCKLLRIGADHVLDGDRPIALLGVRREVNGREAANRKERFNSVATVQHRTGRGGKGRRTALAKPFLGRAPDAPTGIWPADPTPLPLPPRPPRA